MKTNNTTAGETAKKTITRSELFENLGTFRNVTIETPNYFTIHFAKGEAMQSYSSLIGVSYKGTYYFTPDHDCSNTTSKQVKNWCGYSAEERRQGLENGKFINII